jgi:hypothetical protein
MTTTVQLYDTFFDFDQGEFDTLNLTLALIQSTYTFDTTDSNATTDILTDESSGTGYAEITDVHIIYDTDAARVTSYKLDKSGAPQFAIMTISDYRYCLVFDPVTSKPLALIDVGSATPITTNVLTVSGDLIAVSG